MPSGKFFLLLFILLLHGCSSPAPRQFTLQNESLQKVWPAPPELPRYRYVGELTGEGNFLIDSSRQSFLSRLIGLITGSKAPLTLQRPQSGFSDTDGNIYITDSSKQTVFVLDTINGKLSLWEEALPEMRFLSPVAVTQGPNRELLVSDADHAQVFRFSREGKALGGIGNGMLKRPTGVAYDPETSLIYVADTQGHDIKVFDSSGNLIQIIGHRGSASGQFNYPTHLYFHDRLLYVTDSMNARIQVIDRNGDTVESFGKRGLYLGDIPHPKGVAADSDGNIYVVESYFDHLLVYNKHGKFLLPIGGSGRGVGQFFLPAGVWTDNNDRIYVADMFNGRIVVLQYLGGE